EYIDSAFASFNTTITSLKALDEGYSSKNYVRKFLRALHPKWRAKITSKQKLKGKSLALRLRKESSDDECLTYGSVDEYVRHGDKNQIAFIRGSWSDSGEEDDEKVNNEACLVAQAPNEICLGVDLEPDEWIKDSGCSKHTTGNRKLFSTYKAYNGGNVIFDSNLRSNIIGKEPKNVNESLTNDSWIVAMQEELNQFIANGVWELVPQPRNMTIIGTKWVFRNKLNENVARLESIRILLAYACALDFKLFQMDVKSAFLNGFINEEVYVAQPPGFIDFEKPDHVYKLKKALYGLKQAPKACQYQINYSDEDQMSVEFVIQNQFFSYSLEEFAQILDVPYEGACVFSDRWSLDELTYGVLSEGPYQTNLPSPDNIISYIREDREGQVTRIRHRKKLSSKFI
ncbi:retrovirus-related pol polyprotein from transposon TNT 1-94, partial [Tanacetum coccineum]